MPDEERATSAVNDEPDQTTNRELGPEQALDGTEPSCGGSKVHEDLRGADGRAVFFRPERFTPVALEPLEMLARVSLDGKEAQPHRVLDVSQSGLAIEWTPGGAPALDTVLHHVEVSLDGHAVYEGRGRVSSLRQRDDRSLVGISFEDSLIDIDDVLRLRDVKKWARDHREDLRIESRPWFAPSHARFKSLVAELRLFLEDAQQAFDALECELPWHVVHGKEDTAARESLKALVRERFVTPYIDYATRIDTALREASGEDWHHLKDFSRRHVHRFLIPAPVLKRALDKPFGYAGDFQVMRFIYELHFEGSSLFVKAVHLASVHTAASAAVRSRKDRIRSELATLAAERCAQSRPLRIASVAAGPAQEVYELLDGYDELPCPIEVVLLDQAKGALAYAYGRLKRLVDTRFPTGVTVTYLHDSVKHLLRHPDIFRSFGPFDAIVCSGLFDYLSDSLAQPLCSSYHDSLDEGGVAFIGNMVATNPTRWIMEHHLDWFLNYRTPEELLEMGRRAVPQAQVEIAREPTGVNPFLRIRRS